MNTITKAEAKYKSDEEIISFLKKQWDIPENEPISVTAELRLVNADKNHHRIYKLKSISGLKIDEYPLKSLPIDSDILENGIYAPPNFSQPIKNSIKKNTSLFIRCVLDLSSIDEREKHANPLLLAVKSRTVEEIDIISHVDLVQSDNGDILLEDTIIKHIGRKERIKLDERLSKEKKEYEKILQDSQYKLEELKDLEKQTNDKTRLYGNIVSDITSKQELISSLKAKSSNLRIENELIVAEQFRLREELEKKKAEQMKTIEKFRAFLKTKADALQNLEFINEEQYNEILSITPDEENEEESFVDFDKDLESNFSKAIEHIQAYLFNKDIIYPQYLLEDYFSLIQTNDLIILAGDSGSGKTNLVKSFADAVGGVSRIIPVKPSWTSSEDLLGYYNPLQKTYLSTPFLEALIEASNNPDTPYFICLDEMNLARVEYYFADFLSVLEERDSDPEIFLYSDDESNHVLSEFNNVIRAIEGLQNKYDGNDSSNFYDILNNPNINSELKEILGLSDKVSLISYHSTLRRMLGGVLSTPSTITFPSNVRIIGAINIDETTHYLSPKVLDRAHVIKFDNPLLANWKAIEEEVTKSNVEHTELKLKVHIDNFGERSPYPKFSHDNTFCHNVVNLTKDYFQPLGVEIGLRTIRQGLNYKAAFKAFDGNDDIAFNNFILHKILPKFTFDGNTKVADQEKSEIVDDFKRAINKIIAEGVNDSEGRNAVNELTEILEKSKNNDGIINYWA